MFLLADIGGTHTRIVTADKNGFTADPVIFDTPQDFQAAQQVFVKKIQSFDLDKNVINNVVCGFPGSVDENHIVVSAANLPQWVGKDLQELFSDVHTDIVIANDADLAGLGEAVAGAGKDCTRVLYMTISTGVGGALIVDGQIAIAGMEPGWQFVSGCGMKSIQGKAYDHLEYFVSGKSLEKIYQKSAADITDTAVWERVAEILAYGLYNLSLITNPEVIVLGGSVVQALDIQYINQLLKNLDPEFELVHDILVTKRSLADNSGLHGAFALAQKQAS